MTNKEIASKFQLLADLMTLHGADTFRARSYQFLGQSLKNIPDNLEGMEESALLGIKGVGRSTASQILAICATGSFPILEDYLSKTPFGLRQLLRLKGFGPQKVRQWWLELGVESIGELRYAIEENRLLSLKGFGLKSQHDLLEQLAFLQAHENQLLYPDLLKLATELRDEIANRVPGIPICIAGEVARKLPYSGEIDIVLGTSVNSLSFDGFTQLKKIDSSHQRIQTLWDGRLAVNLHGSRVDNLGFRCLELTGSAAFHKSIEGYLAKTPDRNFKDEKEWFSYHNIPFIPAEMREYPLQEILASSKLEEVIQPGDIRGVVHAHSHFSDGSDSLETLAIACAQQGFEYLVITDHSQAAFYANGMKWENILEQHREIDRLNSANGAFRLVKGIECDILPSGELDYSPDILATFEVVIASVHSQLRMDANKAMARLLRAIENPFTQILGHPTGRLLLSRPGYHLDMRKILDACKANQVAVEINANPRRLDLDWSWVPYAMEKQVLLCVNPDAHGVSGIKDITYGIAMARKGRLHRQGCLNTRDVNGFLKGLEKH